MGLAKQEYIRHQEERWSPIDDKLVCRPCLETGDDFRKYFANHSTKGRCDYCKKSKKVANINELLEFIAAGVHSEYEDPVKHMPYASDEGGYYGAPLYSSEELLDNHISFGADPVRDDIVSAFDDTVEWCERDALHDSESDELTYTWNRFAEIVKYERRFFFPRPKKDRTSRIQYNGPRSPGDILTFILGAMRRLNLFCKLPKGTSIFRARDFGVLTPSKLTVENMGIPDRSVSSKSASRLSPAGIPVFYGALSTTHLSQELRTSNSQGVVVGHFRTTSAIWILDLTRIPKPSIFAENDRGTREAIRFLNHFKRDIMRPIEHDESEHVEYVPAQVFSEFIRHRCNFEGRKIAGIKYPSAFSKTDKNLVFYISNERIRPQAVVKAKRDEMLEFLGKHDI